MVPDLSWALIFGGCCSNVFALEAILKCEPDSGLLITVFQFLVVSLCALPSQLERVPTYSAPASNGTAQPLPHHSHSPPPSKRRARARTLDPVSICARLQFKPLTIPMRRLVALSAMFFAVNMLNNWAFAFDISVPMHIILRSFGSVTTLAMGWLHGKRYSRVQGQAPPLPFDNVPPKARASSTGQTEKSTKNFLPGLTILLAAQIVSAYLGVFAETTYARHGRAWQQTLFYNHFFSLLFSIMLFPVLRRQAIALLTAPASRHAESLAADVAAHGPHWHDYVLPLPPPARARLDVFLTRASLAVAALPQPSLYLPLNALTQVVCIAGVNRLSASTTAVTVTVVLNVRKLVSFLLSCYIYSNPVSLAMGLGAGVVFGSGAVYGWEGGRRKESGPVAAPSRGGPWATLSSSSSAPDPPPASSVNDALPSPGQPDQPGVFAGYVGQDEKRRESEGTTGADTGHGSYRPRRTHSIAAAELANGKVKNR